jgi:uncharacterized membrane protein
VNGMRTVRTIGEVLAALFLAATCVVGAHAALVLPATIATHFSGRGADGYGSKLTVLLLPIIGVFLYATIAWVSRMPLERMNLPTHVTPENAGRVRPAVMTLLAWTKATMTGTFAWLELMIVAGARGSLPSMFVWTFFLGLAPVVLLGIFIPVIARAGGAPPSTGKL